MRRWILIVLLGVSVSVQAASYVGFEQITVTTVAVGFTTALITPPGRPEATTASCVLELAQIRWTVDGTVPTTTVGNPLEIGQTLTITDRNLVVNFRSIRTGGTSGQLSCTYTAP